jgi:pimeloyl-ACP methyl ester carboxylesterase
MARAPIILLHGAFSHAGHFAGWNRLFSQAGFECHAPSLPGHAPNDPSALESLTLDDYLTALKREFADLVTPPIIIGHSMGGLLAQQLAAVMRCEALICIASAPPWMLIPQIRALRFLAPIMPAVLSGRPIHPTEATFRNLLVHDLPEYEQRHLIQSFGAESGRAFREMILGLARLPGKRFRGPVLCLSGGEDLIISSRTSKAIARYYGAPHETFPRRGHWLIASSAEQEVAGRVVRWLEEYVPRSDS